MLDERNTAISQRSPPQSPRESALEDAIAPGMALWSAAVLEKMRKMMQGTLSDVLRREDSWKGEMQGIRSDLGALRASLEGDSAPATRARAAQADAPSTGRPDTDVLKDAMRLAVHDGLNDLLAEGGHLRRAVRGEVEAALTEVERGRAHGEDEAGSRCPSEEGARGIVNKQSEVDKFNGFVSAAGSAKLHFAAKLKEEEQKDAGGSYWRNAAAAVERWLDWLRSLDEPPRTGTLDRIVTGSIFDVLVNVVVVLNVALMWYIADVQIKDPSWNEPSALMTIEWLFQIFYTCEILLKLLVHQHWFLQPHECI